MAALDFPASPTVGQIYTANGRSWKWDGVSWISANQITSIGVTGSTLTIYGSPIAYPDATSMTFANSVTLTAASTKTLTLNGGAGSNGLVIDASNNVGIGTTPSVRFTVSNNSSGAYVTSRIENLNTGGYAQQDFLIGAGGSAGQASVSYAPGIFFAIGPSANDTTTPIVFRNNNATTQMTLNASGNLGLGVTPAGIGREEIRDTAKAQLSVYGWTPSGGASDLSGAIYLGNNASYQGRIYYDAVTGAIGNLWIENTQGNSLSAINFKNAGAPYKWFQGATQAMTLDAGGRLLVGNTTRKDNSTVNSYNSGNSWCYEADAASQGGTYYYHVMFAGATQTGRILSTDGTNTQYLTTSDQRLKTNIVPAKSAIQSILDFPIEQFDWISTGKHQDFGAVAQKAYGLIPEMVHAPTDIEEMWAIDWSKAVPRLIKTIQEMHEEIQELKQKVNA